MSEQIDYSKALEQMGREPLEYGEPVGPVKKHQYRINIDKGLFDVLTQVAHEQSVSVNQLIIDTLAERFQDRRASIVLGWIKVARWGEVETDEGECPECGQDIDKRDSYIALLSNGQHYGPVCGACATSE